MNALRSAIPALVLAVLACARPRPDPEPPPFVESDEPVTFPVARSPGPTSIVLFTLDTTRADHLGCYGSAAAKTPVLDALAAQSVLFREAHCTCPITLPSHASMMTGLYPFRHGVRENASFALPTSADTVAEDLALADYETAAFVGSVVLGPATGIAQGFTTFEAPRRPLGPTRFFASIPATEVDAKVAAWWAQRDPARPFFLWVHYYDAHQPYQPPAAFATGAASPYDGEISAVDHAVGEVLALLEPVRAQGRLLTIVTADHGESLGFRGEPTHEIFVYEPVIRVPLLVRWPDGSGAGTVRDDLVSLVDLAPTILDAAGVRSSTPFDGVDLSLPPEPRRAVFASTWYPWLAFGWSPQIALLCGDEKYLHSTRPELYRLAVGAVEGEDRAAAEPERVALLQQTLQRFYAKHRQLGVLARARARLSAESLEQLRSIGYTTISADAGELPGLFPLDPKLPPADAARIARWYRATTPSATISRDAQADDLARLADEEPRNVAARAALGRDLVDLHRPIDAVPVLKKLLELAPTDVDAWSNLGIAHQMMGQLPEAIHAYREALGLDPEAPAALQNLANCLDATGASDEARGLRDRIAKLAGAPH